MQERKFNVDRLLHDLGRYGKYQMLVYFLANLTWISICWHMLVMSFQGATPPHKCVHTNETVEDVQLAYPADDWIIQDEQCATVVNFTNGNATDIECGLNGTYRTYDKDFGKTLVSEWDLVCNIRLKAITSIAGSCYMFGILVGVLITPFGDYYGRRWSLLLCLWINIPISAGIAFVNNIYAFCVLRFFCGMLNSGAIVISWVISCEIVTNNLRSYVGLLGGFFWSVAFMALGLLAYLVRDWRHLQLTISLPFVLYGLYYWLLPETFYFLASHNKYEQLEKEANRAARMNNRKININDYYEDVHVVPRQQQSALKVMLEIVRSPILMINATAMAIIWFVNAFVYYGLSLFSTELAANRFVSFCLSGLVEMPGYISISFLMQWFGRRWSNAVLQAVAGLVLLMLSFTPAKTASGTDLSALILVLSLVGKFAISATFMGVYLYGAEIFPTTTRSVGLGICSTAARAGATLAPYVGVIAAISSHLPPFIFGSLAILAAILTFILPETRGAPLMVTADDAVTSNLLAKCFKRKTKLSLANNLPKEIEPLTDTEKSNADGKFEG